MLLYHFRTPSSKSIRFERVFQVEDPECLSNLSHASVARDKMVAILEQCYDSNATNPELLLTMLNNYVPHLTKMVDQLAELNPKHNQIDFRWSSVLLASRTTTLTSHMFTDELAYTVLVYATTHYQLANQLHKDMSGDESKEGDQLKPIVAHLKVAAGVLEWMQQYLNDKPRYQNVPVDTWPGTCKGLAMLCLTNAQEFSILVAIRRETGWGLIAKLTLAVSEKFREIQQTLAKGLHGKYHNIIINFREYCQQKAQIYKGLSRLYLGREANANSKYGDSVGYYLAAKAILDRMRFPPIQSESVDDVKRELAKHKIVVNRELAAIKKDNDHVYYQPVPKNDDLEIPAPKFIVKSEPFEPPKSDLTYFKDEGVKASAQEHESQIQSDSGAAGWACPACTFLNTSSKSKCDICQTQKS